MLQPRKMFSKVCDSDSAHVILVAISSAFFPETQTPVFPHVPSLDCPACARAHGEWNYNYLYYNYLLLFLGIITAHWASNEMLSIGLLRRCLCL